MVRWLPLCLLPCVAGLALGATVIDASIAETLSGIQQDLSAIQALHQRALEREDERAARCVQDHAVVTRSIYDAAQRAQALQISALATGDAPRAESHARAVGIGRQASAEQLAQAKVCLGEGPETVTERVVTGAFGVEDLAPLSSVLYDWPGMPCTEIAFVEYKEATDFGDGGGLVGPCG